MLSRDSKRLVNAFADRNAGDDDDEFAPPILPVQLEHSLDVTVGLASTGLHLDGQINRASGFVIAYYSLRDREILSSLDSLYVFENLSLSDSQVFVLKARNADDWLIFEQRFLNDAAGIDSVFDTASGRLTFETISH